MKFQIQKSIMILLAVLLVSTNTFAEKKRPLSHVTAEECGSCHKEIYTQWKSSMHANSTALTDPIHGAFYGAVMGDPRQEGLRKKGKYPVCLKCHVPTAAREGKTKIDAKQTYQDGVSCITCHSITKFKGTRNKKGGLQLGIDAYEFTEEAIQGPSGKVIHPEVNAKGEKVPAFKVVGNQTILKTNAVCMGCHDQRNNSNKVALCQTGNEIAYASGSTDCQLCHMPVSNGKVDHSFMGGHNARMVSKGLRMYMENRETPSSSIITLSVENKLPHKLPTGAPFRNIFIKVTGLDEKGNVVWQNAKGHPIKEDPKSAFWYRLGGDDGKDAPPPKATKVLGDTRLKVHETRKIRYELPKSGIKTVKAEAYYSLLLPGLVKKFDKKLPEDVKKAKLISTAELEI